MMTKKQISALAFNIKDALKDKPALTVTQLQHLIAKALGAKCFQAIEAEKSKYPITVEASTELNLEFLNKLQEASAMEIECIYHTVYWNEVNDCRAIIENNQSIDENDKLVLGIQNLDTDELERMIYLSHLFPIRKKVVYAEGSIVWVTPIGEVSIYKNVAI